MIIITGVSRGIGAFLAGKYAAAGERVEGIYQKSTPPESASLPMVRHSSVDIGDFEAVENWVKELNPQGAEITLINCAGINYNSFAHKADIQAWKQVIEINLIGTFNLTRLLLPLMREKGFGRVINCSSVVSQMGVPGTSAYAASKAALNGMIKSLAAENAAKGITFNNLTLGYHNIGMITDVPEAFLKTIIEKIPAGKLGDPENIYQAVEFIRKADYLNGACIDINGGLH
jgi:NAD(P)-dependent dehydrogenase (short-subunit alcohol dehydrogenase family)